MGTRRRVRPSRGQLLTPAQEKGITARGNLSRFARRGDGQAANTFSLDAQQADAATQMVEERSQLRPGSAVETTAQKLTRIRAAAHARSKKRKTFAESDDDDDADEEYQTGGSGPSNLQAIHSSGTALIKVRPPSSMIKPNGSLAYCAGCRKRFSVTQYTAYTARGPICHACGNNAAEDASATIAKAPAKRPASGAAAARRKALLELQAETLPTLQELCINVLSCNIELVDDLSGVDPGSKDKISQAISRNRRLNDKTVKLFLAPDVKQLKLYDCSDVSSHTLRTIADFCPHLESINLQLCGQIDNSVLDTWGDKLCQRQLKSIELYGPFLVRQQSWERFFAKAGSKLTSFKIRESARFNLACAASLAENCPDLTELGLAQIGPLDGRALQPLHRFTNLTYLDISDPGVSAPGVPPKSLQDRDVVSLLSHVGKHLRFLNISGNADLSDAILLAPRGGIKATCKYLLELDLSQLTKLTSKGLVKLFTDWPLVGPPVPKFSLSPLGPRGPGLRKLDLGRISNVDDEALEAVVRHSGNTLTWLSVNSDVQLTADGLRGSLSPNLVPALTFLDVSFIRDVSDGFLVTLMESDEIKQINVFGCNRISPGIRSNKRTKVVGKEREF